MNIQSVKLPKTVVAAARIFIGFWLAGWFLKWGFFGVYLFDEIVRFPLLIEFFPPFLRSPEAAQCFYILPVFMLTAFMRPYRFYFYLSAIIMVLSSAVLLLHQDMHNDATFVTSFWSGVWFLWFTANMHRDDEAFFIHARSLALCVMGLTFWGGFVGKLTPQYWSGQAFADIFMSQNYGLVGEWVRSHYPENVIRIHFEWISRLVILGECFLALAFLWPYRIVFWIGIPFMAGISLFTTGWIFSVLFCLIGLLVAGWRLEKSR
jgi:hypothetical protein